MKFNQISKELNETSEYSSTALTKKGLLSTAFKARITSQLKAIDCDEQIKNELNSAIEDDQIEKALKIAVNALSSSRGINTSKMRSLKNKKFENPEE